MVSFKGSKPQSYEFEFVDNEWFLAPITSPGFYFHPDSMNTPCVKWKAGFSFIKKPSAETNGFHD